VQQINMQHEYPCLFSYVQNKDISVANFCLTDDRIELFHLPLSSQAFSEWEQIEDITVNGLQVSDENIWKYK
jgi:hypothetical protein